MSVNTGEIIGKNVVRNNVLSSDKIKRWKKPWGSKTSKAFSYLLGFPG